jgi:chemotaxis protein CheX
VISYRELKPGDIEVFSEAISAYFEATTGKRANVRSAYLLPGEQACLPNDYNGLIEVSGRFSGSVCFSAPTALLSHVLLASGESGYAEEHHADLVGEIANTFSGRARRHFGESLHISTPRSFRSHQEVPVRRGRSAPYAIPFTWNGYAADLVLNLDAAA